MTVKTPTGEVVVTSEGVDLVLSRSYAAPIADVWASVTEPERTARWFGRWRGEAGPGRTVQVQMSFEGDDPPWSDVHIDDCTPPEHLAVTVTDDGAGWRLELRLAESDGVTTLLLIDHRGSADGVGDFGCGWEWYLDGLSAFRDGSERPSFEDYYPALKEPYEQLARAAGR